MGYSWFVTAVCVSTPCFLQTSFIVIVINLLHYCLGGREGCFK